MSTATITRRQTRKPPSKPWRKLMALIPGYDCLRDSAGCWFEPQAAQDALDFFEKCLTHAEGVLSGQPFLLEPWQKAIVACLFGWKREDSLGRIVRRYREVLIYLPRKQGKTPLCAGLGLFVFFCDPEPGQQGVIAASDRTQASLLFRHMSRMVQAEPELSSRCRIYGGHSSAGQSKSIVREADGSFLRVISADAQAQHGGNLSLAIVDELHTQPSRDLIDVLRTSMSSANRLSPLAIYLTTADFMRESVCNETYRRGCQVRDGIVSDAGFLPVIFEASRDDDWRDPSVWRKANPNLNISKSEDYMRRECELAAQNPAHLATFLRLDLCVQTQQVQKCLDMVRWEACGAGADPGEWRNRMLQTLRGKSCCGGLDLGSVADLCAFALLFGDDDAGYDILPWFWGPRDNAERRQKRDGFPYIAWADAGFVSLTPGAETDYQSIRDDVNALGNTYGIRQIAADRLFQGVQLCQDLMSDGFDVIAFGQGYESMAAPTRRFLELVSGGKLRHGNNPVLTWMASNAASESRGEILKFSKAKSTEKIDGIIAGTMALGLTMLAQEDTRSVYDRENRGFIEIG